VPKALTRNGWRIQSGESPFLAKSLAGEALVGSNYKFVKFSKTLHLHYTPIMEKRCYLACIRQFKDGSYRIVVSALKKGDASFMKTQIVAGNINPIPLHPSGLIVFDLFSEKRIPSSSGRFATRVAAHFFWDQSKVSCSKATWKWKKEQLVLKNEERKAPKRKKNKGLQLLQPACFPDTPWVSLERGE